MTTEDQAAVIDFLAAPATHGGATVERIDTHASIVFLAGARAYKLKRAVRFDYLDFSTPERRRSLCEAEVRLNQRTAPTLYRGVLAVTRQGDGSYSIGGNGSPVDWLVVMNRFSQEHLLDRLAAAGALGLEVMAPLASAIADFHHVGRAPARSRRQAGMAWVIEGNASGFADFARGAWTIGSARRLTDAASRARPSRGAAGAAATIRLRPAVPRRSPFAQHRAVGRDADPLRWRRVQRRDLLHGRLLRSCVSADGSLAATTAAACQRGAEPLPGRRWRHRRPGAPAAVFVLQGSCARQDERDGRATTT